MWIIAHLLSNIGLSQTFSPQEINVDDLMLNLHDPVFYSEDKTESVEALICICTVCLHLYGYFEPAAMAFINELIPTFDQLQEINENPFRAFAIGYICILTVRNTGYTTNH
ncbi:hypothetical protein TVAG_373010 [Trichomonas vaginalis G3]|uniref:Uncharacterized protein n=1 Tax=Trichomonas vaginalis (strain ATCC PRA-98 / G3) TaxID=412133 RepID=A2DZG4_TRIV3|nr:hypothetical protein TVAGG3_0041210 [Trichomonas vaginalis G3]EAY14168.1 hypothetical protein TVAG_373010 [Trichomonas vaginalis G3]KAI5540709.1 hypothetical protein TVAGG3_0041210 [Trichomonas vaginalis G3]|eukprot:XP_001326391.1 hypothetical protein [Trichomonas vaginalis G3]